MISLEQQMPSDVEAEQFVLTSMMTEKTGQAFHQATSMLCASDFILDSHRRIFAAMIEVSGDGDPVDYLTVVDKLGSHKELEAVGGAAYVMGMTYCVPVLKNIKAHAKIVLEKSNLRQIIHIAQGTIAAAYEQSTPSSQVLGVLQDQMLMLLGNANKEQAAKVNEFSEDTWRILLQRREADHRLVGLPTGIDTLDRRTTGIRPGEFWIIGGRAGDGKTSLALQFAAASARQGIPVAFFSIEMDRHSLLERMWSTEGSVDYRRVRDPKFLDAVEIARLPRVRDDVDRWPLFVEDAGSYTIGEIEARSRLLISQHKVKLIIVDYLQIVDAPGKDERLKLTKISKCLRMLAKTGVSVVGLSQMPRPRDNDMNKRPTKFDLKESGSLENDAHTVLMIYRPVDDHNQYTFNDEIVIAKQRSGETGNDNVTYLGKYMRFEPRAL